PVACLPLSSSYRSPAALHLPSFPTRRSSDLAPLRRTGSAPGPTPAAVLQTTRWRECRWHRSPSCSAGAESPRAETPPHSRPPPRSEEHTSELQSRGQLVCRLLLEKNKTRARC